MATAEQANASTEQQPSHQPFPSELPPRKFTQTWWQRNRFRLRTFFTLHYRSFSLRNRHDAPEIGRRISMWLIMLARLVQITMSFGMFFSVVGFKYWASWIAVAVVMVLAGILLSMVTAWSLALIGDAKGTRRVCGVALRRGIFDAFLYVMAVAQVIIVVLAGVSRITTGVFDDDGLTSLCIWLGLGIPILAVGLIASLEPVDQYGMGA